MTATDAPRGVFLRFYEELNDFLPQPRHRCEISYPLTRRTSVKDLIEALGVPHTEVDLILADGRSVDFGHIVAAGERIAVYPRFESLNIAAITRVRPAPLRERPRFVCDVHLGTLARYLRLAGFDTVWRNNLDDAELADISVRDHRVLLTRDRRLLQRRILTHAVFIRFDAPRRQFVQVCERLDLAGDIRPFGRCTRCNGVLASVAKADIEHRLEPKTRRYYHRFWRCEECAQIYWRGSHHAHIRRLLDVLAHDAGVDAVPG